MRFYSNVFGDIRDILRRTQDVYLTGKKSWKTMSNWWLKLTLCHKREGNCEYFNLAFKDLSCKNPIDHLRQTTHIFLGEI